MCRVPKAEGGHLFICCDGLALPLQEGSKMLND